MLKNSVKYVILILSAFYMMGGAFVWAAFMESSSEENIKAAYLFNFAKFVEWPEQLFSSENDPINICVLGDDALSDILELLEKKVVAGRHLKVHCGREAILQSSCHIVFIGESYKKNFKKVLDNYRKKPMLTVSSIKDFAEQGGMIGFVRKGNLIRFEVNRQAVIDSGLNISSRLLKLAVIVDGSTGGQ